MESKILIPSEAEAFVDCLEPADIADIGSPKWYCQHTRLYKLSIQATLNAQKGEEEFVKDYIVSCGKMPEIIYELLITELWKEKILPEIFKLNSSISSIVPIYTVLYHEAIITSLLEVLLFHEDIIETAREILIDLIDYCHRNIVTLLQSLENKSENTAEKGNAEKGNAEMEELLERKNALKFEIGLKSVSFLSCIIQHVKVIPLSCLHRLLSIHDVPMLFVSLVNETPWLRKSADGKTEKYYEGKWNKVEGSEIYKLSKLEGQTWCSLILLLLNGDCLKKYEINDYRRDRLMKLKSSINEAVMNQIPVLEEFLRFLEHLDLCEPSRSKSDIIIEQISERESLIRKHGRKWASIAKKQMDDFFSPTGSELGDLCKRLSDTYDMESLESVLPNAPMCATCHKTGAKRCSRCKNEWYCGRKCQVEHWQKHKAACDLLTHEEK